MTYYLFSGDIEAEALKPVIDFLNHTEGEITLGIDSDGGDTCAGYFFLDILNAMKERVTLVAAGNVYSFALDLFFLYKGKKSCCKLATGMTHLTYIPSAEVNSKGVPEEEVKARMPAMQRAHKEDIKWLKTFLTADELRKYNKGDKIYLDDVRLAKIAKEHNSKL